jgi:3-oxoacyl-[acyl-carrier protein] reductase
MKLGLGGKGVIVTGGSRGIGRATALGFADEGAHVAICARGPEALQVTAAELRARDIKVHAQSCDLADGPALDTFLDDARAALGRVDVLVCNASGFGLSEDESGWRRSLDVDVRAAVRASERVVPWLEEAGGGAILFVSSTLGGLEADDPAPLPYTTVKGALVSLSKALALRLAKKNVRVACVAPGAIEFPGGLWEQIRTADPASYERVRATIPFGRLGTPEEVASVIVFLASDAARWVTGVTLAIDGGQHKGNL